MDMVQAYQHHEERIRAIEIAIAEMCTRLSMIVDTQKHQLESQRWLTRIVLGAVVMAAVGFLLSGGTVIPKTTPSVPPFTEAVS